MRSRKVIDEDFEQMCDCFESLTKTPRKDKIMRNMVDYFGYDRVRAVIVHFIENDFFSEENTRRAKILESYKPYNLLYWWCKNYKEDK